MVHVEISKQLGQLIKLTLDDGKIVIQLTDREAIELSDALKNAAYSATVTP